MTISFSVHPRLAADSALICEWPLSRVLLMNDVRFPWIVLVPRRQAIVELFELGETDRTLLTREITRASEVLKSWAATHGPCDKINIAMIGNIVPQLHVHIVARAKNDSEWPHPVWGRGEPLRYSPLQLQRSVSELSQLLEGQ